VTSRPRAILCGLLALTVSFAAARAEEPVSSLQLQDVLDSARVHYPGIVQGLAARRVAAGRLTEAAGEFDLVFAAEGFSRLGGFYDGTAVEGTVRQPLRPLGGSLYAGYKLSDGTFPVYEDERFTNTGGAVKVGLLFSLLRDRNIDERRFRQADAYLEAREADFDLLLTRIGVQQRALEAYWRWVAAGRQLAVYRDLLRIALERRDGLTEQVARGARARIFLTENQQNITRRRIRVMMAERDLAMAANRLSLYYRDESGAPVVPSYAALPPSEANAPSRGLPPPSGAVSDALNRRPELELLRLAIEREQRRIELRANDLRPRLDLNLELRQPLGSVAEGGPSRDTTDTVLGFTFSVPLQQRRAEGRLLQSRAEVDAMRAERRLVADRIELEVRNLLLDLEVSERLLSLAEQEVEQAELLRKAEVRRFESGASDFFLVNLREEAAADARIRYLDAELTARIARGSYDAATVNLSRLGLEGGASAL
jgi:outer membrane protein TolC